MIHDQKLDKLFEKQEEKGYKFIWVLFQYLETTPIGDIGKKDKLVLTNLFKISEEFLDKQIEKIALSKQEKFKERTKEQNREYFLEKTFARGIDSKQFDRHTKFDD